LKSFLKSFLTISYLPAAIVNLFHYHFNFIIIRLMRESKRKTMNKKERSTEAFGQAF
jgi:hypothetical protein